MPLNLSESHLPRVDTSRNLVKLPECPLDSSTVISSAIVAHSNIKQEVSQPTDSDIIEQEVSMDYSDRVVDSGSGSHIMPVSQPTDSNIKQEVCVGSLIYELSVIQEQQTEPDEYKVEAKHLMLL